MKTKQSMDIIEALQNRITGAIERGESQGIAGIPAKFLFPVKSPIGAVWFFSDSPFDFEELATCGFSPSKRNGREVMEACIMSGAVAKAEACGFQVYGKGAA